jgi:hypothetical protein
VKPNIGDLDAGPGQQAIKSNLIIVFFFAVIPAQAGIQSLSHSCRKSLGPGYRFAIPG